MPFKVEKLTVGTYVTYELYSKELIELYRECDEMRDNLKTLLKKMKKNDTTVVRTQIKVLCFKAFEMMEKRIVMCRNLPKCYFANAFISEDRNISEDMLSLLSLNSKERQSKISDILSKLSSVEQYKNMFDSYLALLAFPPQFSIIRELQKGYKQNYFEKIKQLEQYQSEAVFSIEEDECQEQPMQQTPKIAKESEIIGLLRNVVSSPADLDSKKKLEEILEHHTIQDNVLFFITQTCFPIDKPLSCFLYGSLCSMVVYRLSDIPKPIEDRQAVIMVEGSGSNPHTAIEDIKLISTIMNDKDLFFLAWPTDAEKYPLSVTVDADRTSLFLLLKQQYNPMNIIVYGHSWGVDRCLANFRTSVNVMQLKKVKCLILSHGTGNDNDAKTELYAKHRDEIEQSEGKNYCDLIKEYTQKYFSEYMDIRKHYVGNWGVDNYVALTEILEKNQRVVIINNLDDKIICDPLSAVSKHVNNHLLGGCEIIVYTNSDKFVFSQYAKDVVRCGRDHNDAWNNIFVSRDELSDEILNRLPTPCSALEEVTAVGISGLINRLFNRTL